MDGRGGDRSEALDLIQEILAEAAPLESRVDLEFPKIEDRSFCIDKEAKSGEPHKFGLEMQCDASSFGAVQFLDFSRIVPLPVWVTAGEFIVHVLHVLFGESKDIGIAGFVRKRNKGSILFKKGLGIVEIRET